MRTHTMVYFFSNVVVGNYWIKVANSVGVKVIVIVSVICANVPWQVIFPNIVIGLEGAQCTNNHFQFVGHSRLL